MLTNEEFHRNLEILKIKSVLRKDSDAKLIDDFVKKYGLELKICPPTISMETFSRQIRFVVGNKSVLTVDINDIFDVNDQNKESNMLDLSYS